MLRLRTNARAEARVSVAINYTDAQPLPGTVGRSTTVWWTRGRDKPRIPNCTHFNNIFRGISACSPTGGEHTFHAQVARSLGWHYNSLPGVAMRGSAGLYCCAVLSKQVFRNGEPARAPISALQNGHATDSGRIRP